MKRLLALFAILFGMAALVAPAHARMAAKAESSAVAGNTATSEAKTDRYGQEARPDARRKKRERELGKPDTESYRTVIVPTVMLVDRPLT